MKALVITRTGTPVHPNIRLVTDWSGAERFGIAPDKPGPGEALLRTLASALNHLDLWVGRGVPGLDLTYPRVSGSDACAVVDAVGPGVDPAWVGKKVILNAAIPCPRARGPWDAPDTSIVPEYDLLGEHANGTHRERFIAPISNLAAINDSQDPAEAAAFGLTFLTAYSMLIGKAGLRPGQAVLITGIGGGVALAALAIARYLGCPTAVTTRQKWKQERAAALGANLAILDEGQEWFKDVRAWTGRRGVDVAVDSSGKATHLNCIKSLARGGAYVTPGCTSGPDATTDLARIYWHQLRILGSTMSTPAEFAEVVSLYRAGSLRPVVDKTYPAEQGAEAYQRLESAEQFGKIVLTW